MTAPRIASAKTSLILTRRKGEMVTLPDVDVQIEIFEVKGSRVKFRFVAPRDLKILRAELDAKDTQD